MWRYPVSDHSNILVLLYKPEAKTEFGHKVGLKPTDSSVVR